MQEKFLTQLQTWAKAGDGDCAYKLATIYRAEGDLKNYFEWLEKSAATKNFDAMKEFADHLRESADYEKSFALYKELAETFCDEESMEKIVDIFQTRRHNELTMETLQAIERRRIAARIRKLLNEN